MANRLREGEPQVRIHTWIYKADKDRIDALFGKTTGHSKVIRLIIRKWLNMLEQKALAQGKPLGQTITQEIQSHE